VVDIVLATGQVMPHGPAIEDPLLVDALQAHGVGARVEPWGSEATAAASLVVVRTTWDYTDHVDDFLAWVRRTAEVTTLVNPAEVIVWNSHKSYLHDLAKAGVPVIPTTVVDGGSPEAQQMAALAQYDADVVIKPVVAVGADRTIRVDPANGAASAHLRSLTETGGALIQPFVPAIVSGEVSLIYLGGSYSHAVRKVPAAGDYRVQVFYGGAVEPHARTAAERDVAEAALGAVPNDLAYARVDLVDTTDGPMLMELELIEPQLFLDQPDAALNEFARHLVGLLGGD
jgi:glutathione synthase/RimK-type ligase-like ATP-grasp enzyme